MKKIMSALFITGLILSSACSNKQKEQVREEYYDTKESVEDTWDRAGDRIDRGVDRVEDAWDDTKENLREGGRELRRDINEVDDTVKHKLD